MTYQFLPQLSDEDVRYRFSGHETFPFRYTWLTKGVQKVQEYPDLFFRDDAVVILGVGKNMVASIRHWCEALNLIEPIDRSRYRPTEIGLAVFGKDGWDPYLEHQTTLWLLHWLLVSKPERASTWYLMFSRWNFSEFTEQHIVERLLKIIARSPTSQASPASLKRDVDVFLRTYIQSKVTPTRPREDTFDCPLVELGLIVETAHGIYEFVRGPKPLLQNEIFVFALLDFWTHLLPNQGTVSFETLSYAPGSPGSAFKMSENAIAERLENLPSWSGLSYGDTAGTRILLKTRPQPRLIDILANYYKK
ncbi:MAG: DUF4007 family protein [Thaumarchaeota archaeon]|nr:DUF4007 family protein [Nitrososphaerota archaeon]